MPSHHTNVPPEYTSEHGQRYRAECSCGWVNADADSSKDRANEDAAAHVRREASIEATATVIELIPVDGCVCSRGRCTPAPNCWAKVHDHRYAD